MIHEKTGFPLVKAKTCNYCRALVPWEYGKCDFGFKTKPREPYQTPATYIPLEPCLKATTCKDHAEKTIAILNAQK